MPTGEFWLGAACGVTPRLAASIAHLGGRAIAAAENLSLFNIRLIPLGTDPSGIDLFLNCNANYCESTNYTVYEN